MKFTQRTLESHINSKLIWDNVSIHLCDHVTSVVSVLIKVSERSCFNR